MKFLGIIPARGGSKGIKRKNIAFLNGKELIGYTCEAAIRSKNLNRVIVSSDCAEIVEVCKRFGVSSPFMRPSELAQDDSLILDVIIYILKQIKARESYIPDAVVLLQPTSPLRTSEHIDEALSIMIQNNADSVVSVVEVPHAYTPTSLMQICDNKLIKSKAAKETYRRQEKPKFYARNGPAILAVKTKSILSKKSFYDGLCMPYVMPISLSLDVDNADDLKICEYHLNALTK